MRVEFIIGRGSLSLGDRVKVRVGREESVGNVTGFLGDDRVMVCADVRDPEVVAFGKRLKVSVVSQFEFSSLRFL